MTVYEIPNIEHCTVDPVLRTGTGETIGYTITSNDGWYIHLNDDVEDTVNLWKTVVILPVSYDSSIVYIRAFEDLPKDAEICGGVNSPTEKV